MDVTILNLVFYALAVVAIGSALGVVFGRSPVASLLFMVSTLGSVAGIYVLLEAHFLAAIQVMVYAGAIMVLFLFVIMLLNLGHDYQQDLRGWAFSLLALGVSGGIGGLLVQRFFDLEAAGLSLGLAGVGASELDASIQELGALGVIAEPLYTTYVVPFEITGILLLVAIVGALVLAKRNVEGSGRGGEDLQ
ncbi:MAG TPA: NADH-quinone oxidoreductase subunit J [Longimicrobiales bacterium]|nr:NADH-quinone oxidoreductase subunit J [Longimicrobiales bacterium]